MKWDQVERLYRAEHVCVLFQGWHFSPGVWERWKSVLEISYDVVLLWDIYNPPSNKQWKDLQSVADIIDIYAWSLGGLLAMDVISDNSKRINHFFTFNSFPRFVTKPGWSGVSSDLHNVFLNNLTNKKLFKKSFLLPCVIGGLNHKQELSYLTKHMCSKEIDAKKHKALLDKLFRSDFIEKWKSISCDQTHFIADSDSIVPSELYDDWQKVPDSLSSNVSWVTLQNNSHASFLLDPVSCIEFFISERMDLADEDFESVE